MGRKSRAAAPAYHEVPGCFNGIWNGVPESEDTTPVVARKSLSERKFSEGFEAPRNSLDISSAAFESMRQCNAAASAASDEIPFGFEFALRKSTDRAPPRVSVTNPAASADNRCRSPSVIARLMGLDTLPAEQPLPELKRQGTTKKSSHEEFQLLPLPSESRRSLLASRSTKERYSGSSNDQVRNQQQQQLTRQLSCNSNSRLNPSRAEPDEFLLFDVLPFRDHPQEKQLEKIKQEFQAQRQRKEEQFALLQKKQSAATAAAAAAARSVSVPEKLLEAVTNTKREPGEPKEMLDAIQFLQSNKEFLVKFLQEPNSVFARHVYDLQALAAKEAVAEEAARRKSRSLQRTPKEIVTQQQDNIGFSRKLVESRKDRGKNNAKKELVQQQQRNRSNAAEKIQIQDDKKIVLLKSNAKQSSTTPRPISREIEQQQRCEDAIKKSRCLKNITAATTDPREMARQIARQVRENVTKEIEKDSRARSRSASPWSFDGVELAIGGGEGSEPSSRRYSKDFQVHQSTASLPSSPKLTGSRPANVSSKEGRKQLMQKLKLAAEANQSDDESSRDSSASLQTETGHDEKPKKHKGGKLLKLFSRETAGQTLKASSSDDSPRLLVRSKSVPENKSLPGSAEALDRSSSSRSPAPESSSSTASSPRGKFSSLKNSLLGKKKNHHSRTTSEPAMESAKPSPKQQQAAKIEHSASSAFEDHYLRTFRETEAQLAGNYERCQSDKFDQSPSFLSVDLDQLDASSDIHIDKSEQPSPVSVLERGFIEGSPSPVSFEDASSDLQELQTRLERLKLDESGRSRNLDHLAASSEFVPGVASIDSSRCSPTSQDHLYISKLIHASGFSSSIGSLFAWHSPTYPIDPYLFGKLEEDYICSESISPHQPGKRRSRKLKIGRIFTQVQRHPETLHRQMLFDLVNEVLSQKFQHLWEDHPKLGNEGIRPIPTGKYLLHEIDQAISVYRHDYDSADYSLENLVERDLTRGDHWGETGNDLRKIGTEVEASILNSLVEELAIGLIR